MEKAGLRYARTVHLDWPDPLEGNEHGDVEYRLRRAGWTDPGALPPGHPGIAHISPVRARR
jgi:hypothetical protein